MIGGLMRYSLKLSPVRPLAIALVMFLFMFGASVSTLSAHGNHCCSSICSTCTPSHEATVDRCCAVKTETRHVAECSAAVTCNTCSIVTHTTCAPVTYTTCAPRNTCVTTTC